MTPTFCVELPNEYRDSARILNIFLTDQDEKALDRLSDEERRVVIEYCKYRLGIATELNTQDELNACKTM